MDVNDKDNKVPAESSSGLFLYIDYKVFNFRLRHNTLIPPPS